MSERAVVDIPADKDKYRWQRRYTSLVSQAMASRDGGALLSPAGAGAFASRQVQEEWVARFPNESHPDWMTRLS